MLLHTWCHQGPCKPSSCTTFIIKPHWGRAATGKKKKKDLHLYTQGHYSHVQLFVNFWTVACQASLSGSSRQEYWSVLANTDCHTFQSTIFPAVLAANSPEYLVLTEPLQSKLLHQLNT